MNALEECEKCWDNTNNQKVKHYSVCIETYSIYVQVPKNMSKSELSQSLTCELENLNYYDYEELEHEEDVELPIIFTNLTTQCCLESLDESDEDELCEHGTKAYNTALVSCSAYGDVSVLHDGDFDADRHSLDQCFDVYVHDGTKCGAICDVVDFNYNENVYVAEAMPKYVHMSTRLANWWRCVVAKRKKKILQIGQLVISFGFQPSNPDAPEATLRRRGGGMFQETKQHFEETKQ